MQTSKVFCLVGQAVLTSFFLSVPGDAGRNLVQRYFEAEHSATAIIHPKTELAISSPGKRNRKSARQTALKSHRETPQGIPSYPTAPAPSLQPAYRPIYGQGVLECPPYTGYASLNNRTLPVALSYGMAINAREDFANYSKYRHGSFPFRY